MAEQKPTARDLAKHKTREALVQAGIEMFSAEGVDLPSLDAICARAGFTRGAFYVHFRDRDDLLVAVIDKVLTDFVNSVIASGGAAGDLQQTVQQFLSAAASGAIPLIGKHRGLLSLLGRGVQGSEDIQPKLAALVNVAVQRLADAAARGQQAGQIRQDISGGQIGLVLVAAALGLASIFELGVAVDVNDVKRTVDKLLTSG